MLGFLGEVDRTAKMAAPGFPGDFEQPALYCYVWVGEGPFFSGLGGEMYIDPDFLVALGRQFPNESGQPLDLLKRPPDRPAKNWTPLTLDKLKTGFESFTVSYHRGARLREARISDRQALDELAKALVVTKWEEEKTPKDWPPQQFHFHCKGETDAPTNNGCILDREHLVLGNLGRVEIKPSFVKTLNAQLSRLEGRDVDVLGKNPPPKEQLQREQALRDLLATARHLRFHREDGKEILVQQREDVAQLLKSLAWVETPVRAWKLERSGGFIEVTTAKEETIRFTYLHTKRENEKVDVDSGGDLAEVTGFGVMWLDSRFRDAVRLYGEQWEFKDEQRRSEETYRLVCQDLPAFLEQVFNLVVHFREGKDQLLMCLTAEDSQPILEALRHAKIEKMSWTDKQWDEEVQKLLEKRGAGSLVLEPGIGFSMFVVFRGEKELLVPRYGRIVLREPIIDKLRKALESDPKKAMKLEFLPCESK
jgi:hypothetical protein